MENGWAFLQSRILYAKAILWRRTVALTMGTYGVCMFITWAAEQWRHAPVYLSDLIPHWSTAVWIAIGLGLLLLLAIEGSLDLMNKSSAKHNQDLTAFRESHAKSIADLRERPYEVEKESTTTAPIKILQDVKNPHGQRFDTTGEASTRCYQSIVITNEWSEPPKCARKLTASIRFRFGGTERAVSQALFVLKDSSPVKSFNDVTQTGLGWVK